MLKVKYVVLLILWLPSIVVAQGYTQADVEELFYARGMAQTQGLQEYLETSLNVDLKYKSSFITGLREGATNYGEAKKAYNAGIQIGEQITDQMMAGIIHEVFEGKELLPSLKKRFTHKYVDGLSGALEKTAKYTTTNAKTIAESKKKKFKAALQSGQQLSKTAQQEADDMFYAEGVAQTEGLEEYLKNNLELNMAYKSQFIKGLKEAGYGEQTKERHAFYAGIQIGDQVSSQMILGLEHEVFGEYSNDAERKVHRQLFLKGFIDAINKTGKYSIEKAQDIAKKIIEKIKREANGDKYKDNREQGERFLASNKTKTGVHVLPSGVQYKVLKAGTARKPRSSSKVKVHYEGKTLDDNVFDSSYKRGGPIELRCNQVIKGWTDALVNMTVGSIWEVYIPQELAYAEREQEDIKPYSMLIFKIELISITEY